MGWDKLLRARPQAASIAELTEEDPLVRAADRWTTLRKFVPDLLEAVDFKAGKGSTETVAAVAVLRELNKSGRRELPDKIPNNLVRPHSSLGWMTPAPYGASSGRGRGVALREGSAPRPIATGRNQGSDQRQTLLAAG